MTRKKITIIALSVLLAVLLIGGIIAAVYFLSNSNPYGKTYTYEEAMGIYDSGDKMGGIAALRTAKGKKAKEKRKEIYLSMFTSEFYEKVQEAESR